MKDTLFDELIRSKMDPYQSEVPAQAWENIADALRKKKRRPLAIWWWKGILPALLLMAIGTAAYFALDKKQDSQTADNTVLNSNKAGSNNTGNAQQQGISAINTSELNSNNQQAPANNTDNNNINTTNQHSTTTTIASSNISNSINNNLADNDNNTTINKKPSVTTSAYTSSRPKQKGLNKNFSFTDLANNNDNNGATAIANDKLNTDLAEKNFSLAMMRASMMADQPSLNKSLDLNPTFINCPTIYGQRRNDWYLDLYAAPVFVSRSLNPTASNYNDAVHKKDSSETMRVSYSAGANIVKNIGNRLLLKTGINYSLTNEKFTYSKINSIQNITIITVKKIPRGPGDTVYVYDTATIQQIGRLTKKVTNRYHSFDVPLILGYETKGENIRFNINAGVIFNLTTISKGEMLNGADSVVNIKSSGYFKNNIGLGLYGSVMMLKKINDNMDFFVEPYIRQNLGNMATDKAYFKQTLRQTGLNVGIRLKLNNR